MKKIILFTVSMLLISCLLCGCLPTDEVDIGQAKTFEKEGFSITLTDKFKEEESQRGFDAYFVSNFSGVVVLKEDFALEEGLAEKSLGAYIADVIENNGHTDISPQVKDGFWFYEKNSDGRYAQSYCYKGSDAFWIVQFICNSSDANAFEDIFYQWAQSVEVR